MNRIISTFLLVMFSISFPAYAYEIAEKDWGIAVGIRSATIPYPAKDEKVGDFIPLMFYDSDIFFIEGLTGGTKLYQQDKWQFNLIGRYRYFDLPAEYQNLLQANAVDVGLELEYKLDDDFELSIEVMRDDESRFYSELRAEYYWKSGSWRLFPYASLRFKSSDFNNYYYGLDGFIDPNNPSGTINNKIGRGTDLTLGSEIRYHVASNFYLIGRAQFTVLDNDTRSSLSIDEGVYEEIFLGIAFFNDETKSKTSSLKAKPYVRFAHGWATPSNIGEILNFDWEDDQQDNQLTSLFYGHPLADNLFGIKAIDLYMTLGYVYHHSSVSYDQTLEPDEGINTIELSGIGQNSCDGINPCTITYNSQPTREYVLGIKAYYNIHWPIHWRFGFAEGISYIQNVSNIEQREMDRKGYRSSNLMNYLDFTIDFSLGDAFNAVPINDWYFGVGVHHRSSIFESSSAFGRIKGGSNYNSIYLQYHFR